MNTPGMTEYTVITRVAQRHWHALDDDQVVGRGDASRRPDGRIFLSIDAWHDAVFDQLAEAMLAEPAEAAVHGGRRGRRRPEDPVGCAPASRPAAASGNTSCPPTRRSPASARCDPPAGVTIVPVGEAREDPLRTLDRTIRDEIEATVGWAGDAGRGAAPALTAPWTAGMRSPPSPVNIVGLLRVARVAPAAPDRADRGPGRPAPPRHRPGAAGPGAGFAAPPGVRNGIGRSERIQRRRPRRCSRASAPGARAATWSWCCADGRTKPTASNSRAPSSSACATPPSGWNCRTGTRCSRTSAGRSGRTTSRSCPMTGYSWRSARTTSTRGRILFRYRT